MLRFFAVVLAFVCFACVIGCGPSGPPTVVVKGKLLKGGAPLAVPRSDVGLGWVQLELTPEGGAAAERGPQLSAKDDGSFEFLGEANGVLPGSYRLSVLHYEQGPPNDKLNGAFSPQKTPIRVTVPGDKGKEYDLGTIDLDNPPQG